MMLLSKLLGDVPMTYNEGGGKSGGGQIEVAKPMQTTTSVGSALDAPVQTFEEDKKDSVDKKKMGTRGLQIPMVSPKTAASVGVGV